MKKIVRIFGTTALVVLFMCALVAAQDRASIQRDFHDICPDSVIGDGMGGFYPGHYTLPNWYSEGGTGYVAVVSRDDLTDSQLNWDCSNDIVAGSVVEKPVVGAGYSRITAVLKYEMPLEVWTVDGFVPGIKVLDGGFFEANVTRKLVLYGGPGAPLNFTFGGPTYFWHIAG